MASFVQRALMYLGLKDIDDEEDYDGDDEEVAESLPRAGCGRAPIPNLRRRGRASPPCARSPATRGARRTRRWPAALSCGRS